MTVLLRHPMMSALMLVSFLAMGGLSPALSVVNEDPTEEGCPPCELFFRKLEQQGENGKLSQVVKVQERGEPKSGTGFMFDWATGALIQTCRYLQGLFGEASCVVQFKPEPEDDGYGRLRPITRRFVFEPALGVGNAKCPCETIERVTIVLSKVLKHTLPVRGASCAFSHRRGIDLAPAPADGVSDKTACKFADGTRVKTHHDLWLCMHEANCDITDDWLQMAVFRDPRPAVVSAYFFLEVQSDKDVGDLEAFIARELPIMCQWLAIRYILFLGLIPHQSFEFWYKDAIADPMAWHYHWLDSVGLQLPHYVVAAAARLAAANELDFGHKKVDSHPGEGVRTDAGVRRFEDEASPEIRKAADAVLRVWLPPVLLEKLGVAPTEEGE